MFIEVAEVKALALMAEHGLVQQGWKFEFHRGSRYLGWCLSSRKVISLSSIYVENNEWEPLIKGTVLHEIAHYFCPPFYRNGQWKKHHK